MSNPTPPVLPEEIEPSVAARQLAGSDAPQLVDCREADEFAITHLAGAKLLPLSQWQTWLPGAFADPQAPVLIYCHHGIRSLRATRALRQHGFSSAQSIAGGIDRWAKEIDTSLPLY